MSLSSWKKEFYRTPADKVSKKYALRHSLKKWIGLEPSNLKKHNVILVDGNVVVNRSYKYIDRYYLDDVANLGIDASSCALCQHFYSGSECIGCPLADAGFCCIKNESPYEKFVDGESATPMIRALEKALKKGK